MRIVRKTAFYPGNYNGFTIIECLIALVVVGIAIVAYLELVSTAVKNGTFTRRLDDVKSLASKKASELAKDADSLAKLIPSGKRSIGTLAPAKLLPGYSQVLNESFQPIADPGNVTSPKFILQWMIIKDLPQKNEITVLVSCAYKYGNKLQIVRVAEAVKTDGIKTRNS